MEWEGDFDVEGFLYGIGGEDGGFKGDLVRGGELEVDAVAAGNYRFQMNPHRGTVG